VNDAQFTLANIERRTILRPFAGFEAVYEGKSTTTPIVFPGTLDKDAGTKGFSPYLLAGIPAPLGAKCCLWLPAVAQLVDIEGADIPIDYGYVIHWRLRNVGDFNRSFDKRREPQPFHLSDQNFAAQDTLLDPTPPDRFLLPSATETIIFEQLEPTGAFGPSTPGAGVGNLRTQAIAVPSDATDLSVTLGLPFLPPGSPAPPFASAYPPGSGSTTPLGAFQQGVVDPANFSQAPYSIFRPYFTIAKGDEMMIAVTRRPVGALNAPWSFSTIDALFSNVYGTNVAGPTHKPFENLGIYVFFGTNPS
jgi:hypothetical protein